MGQKRIVLGQNRPGVRFDVVELDGIALDKARIERAVPYAELLLGRVIRRIVRVLLSRTRVGIVQIA